MIHEGTDLKYKIAVSLQGFSLDNDDFTITIRNGYGQTKYAIAKSGCFRSRDGNWYFGLSAVERGVYFATFTALVKDGDFPDGTQAMVDMQHLADVDMCESYTVGQCDCLQTEGMTVAYERITLPDLIEKGEEDEWSFGMNFPVTLK